MAFDLCLGYSLLLMAFDLCQDCNFDRNLKVHILQQVEGNETDLGNFEDKWITRLDTKEPHGMNSTMGELAKTHYKLFSSF